MKVDVVTLDIPNETLIKLTILAHEKDITLNQLVQDILLEACIEAEKGPGKSPCLSKYFRSHKKPKTQRKGKKMAKKHIQNKLRAVQEPLAKAIEEAYGNESKPKIKRKPKWNCVFGGRRALIDPDGMLM
jgi:hypothetical protein